MHPETKYAPACSRRSIYAGATLHDTHERHRTMMTRAYRVSSIQASSSQSQSHSILSPQVEILTQCAESTLCEFIQEAAESLRSRLRPLRYVLILIILDLLEGVFNTLTVLLQWVLGEEALPSHWHFLISRSEHGYMWRPSRDDVSTPVLCS